MATLEIRPLTAADTAWVSRFTVEHWGSPVVVSRYTTHRVDQLPGFIAYHQGGKVGLITYHLAGDECEIVTINSIKPALGVGSALIDAVKDAMRQQGCRRIWLITTNDNLNALRFYQKRGFALVAVHRNAVDEARKQKPEIPLIGNDGIPIRDEIELEVMLD